MNSKKMFEDLGFVLIQENGCIIVYEYKNSLGIYDRIVFEKRSEVYFVELNIHKYINFNLHKAINQQVKELLYKDELSKEEIEEIRNLPSYIHYGK